MLELEQKGYYPLTRESVELYAPANPGIYMLATRHSNKIHRPFFATQSDNLHSSLLGLLNRRGSTIPPSIRGQVAVEECYFTFLVIPRRDYRNEVEKMLTHTADPVLMLKVVNCN